MSTATITIPKGVADVAYETKVILISLADLACRTEAREVYDTIRKMANAEGVILESYEDARAEMEKKKETKD